MSTSIQRARSAQVSLFSDRVYVFSDMLVDRLGTTPLRLVAAFSFPAAPQDLGAAVRSALAESLPWIEWEEFKDHYDSLGDPISKAFGIPNKGLTKAGKQSGRVTVDDWPNKSHYSCTAWVKKGASGKPLGQGPAAIPKDCSDGFLGELVQRLLGDSLSETLALNKR